MQLPTDRVANEIYEVATQTRNGNRRYLGMSQIGDECLRKLWFYFRGYPATPVEGRVQMIFRMGDFVEQEVINLLGRVYRIDGQQQAFEAHNGFFRGHCDGVIYKITQRPHILEIKSANDKKFKEFKDRGVEKTYYTYYAQAQCYMGYANLERALFVIYNKNSSEIYSERVYYNPSVFHGLHEKARFVISANGPPEKTPNHCDWCDYKLMCDGTFDVPNRACGTCRYLWFEDVKPYCQQPQHSFEIKRWGECCDDWASNATDVLGSLTGIPF